MLEKKESCTPSAAETTCEDPSTTIDQEPISENNGHLTCTSGGGERLSPSNKSSTSSTSHLLSNSHNDCNLFRKSLSNSDHLPQNSTHPEVMIEDQDSNETSKERSKSQSPILSRTSEVNFHTKNTTTARDYTSMDEEKKFLSIELINDEGSTTGSDCSGSVASSSGKRSKSKESYHSSDDQVIDEEDLHAISDSDYAYNEIPIIPGVMKGNTNTSSDVDSAFEDSHYSGSSDDKTKKGTSLETRHSSKNKIKRRPTSKHSNEQTNSHKSKGRKREESRCEDIAEMDGSAQDELQYDNVIYPRDRNASGQTDIVIASTHIGKSYQGRGNLKFPSKHELDHKGKVGVGKKNVIFGGNDYERVSCPNEDIILEDPHYLEPTLFEMEVSPANLDSPKIMPMHDLPNSKRYEDLSYQTLLNNDPYYNNLEEIGSSPCPNNSEENIPLDDLVQGQNESGDRTSKDLSDHYTIEEDLDDHGNPTTILLPPLEVRVLSTDQSYSPTGRRESSMSQQIPAVGAGDENFYDGNGNKPSVLISSEGDNPNTIEDIGQEKSNGKRNNANGESNETNEEGEDFKVAYVVPDGGWGWMVLFGSILVNILIPGTVKSFGVLFVEFLEVFKASPVAAAWIPALSYWLYSSMGPFASALAIRFSHRSVTIVGGLLASFGLMLSYFATSISYLYISYGIIGGLGAGLAYPIGVFMVGQYFDKRRGLANGLCTSGSALGSVLIPPLLRVLLVEYGYRGAILIMGAILLNVCVGAMFYDPVSKHMKRVLIPKEKVEQTSEMTEEDNANEIPVRPARQATNPIDRNVQVPIRDVAASMPIAIPLPPQKDFRDLRERRGSGSGRRATFQIGHETPQGESWSFKSNEMGSPLAAARLAKDDPVTSVNGASSPNHWSSLYNQAAGIRVRGHIPYINNDSNPELETLIHSNSSGMMVTPGGTTLSLSAMGTSRGHSRLNLTAIPEDDDTASDSGSKQVDWNFYSGLAPAKQSLLRLSMGGGTQLMGSHGTQMSHHTMISQTGLSRTLSVASNVSSSSFHYMNTIHHGSLLSAMQLDKNIPEFASTLTLKSVRKSCCPLLATLKGFCRKLTCGIWPKGIDEKDRASITSADNEELGPKVEPRPKRKTDRLKKFIDFSLLNDGMYLIMLFSNSTTAVGYTNFIVLLPSYALALGFDKSEAAFLLSIVAAFDFVGRIGGAALSDLQFISRKWFYIVGLFFSGIALALLPIARTYSSLATFCSLFGLASGTYIGVTAVILADQLGAEKLGSSYGISLFLNGLLQLIGPPICGVLLQEFGRFEPIFTGLGVTLIFGALLWIFDPFIERHRRIKEQQRLQNLIMDEEHLGVEDRLTSSTSAPVISNGIGGPTTTIVTRDTPVLHNGKKSVTSLV